MNKMSKLRFRIGYILASATLILLVSGCSTPAFNSKEALGAENQGIKVTTAKPQTATGDITVTGILDADTRSTVSSQIPGKIATLLVKEGSYVKKGDLLMTLDDSDLQSALQKAQLGVQQSQAAVDQAKINYDNAQKTVDRLQQLLTAGAIAQKDLDQATVARDLAKTQYDSALNVGMAVANQGVTSAEQALAKASIVSPIEGTITGISVNSGDNISPYVPLATIVTSNQMVLTGNVSENLINSLKVGLAADLQVDSVRDLTLPGTLTFISPVSIPTGQFFPVKIALNKADSRLKPGMTASAHLHINDSANVTVPTSAVIRRDGRNFVFVLQDEKAVKVPVQLGLQGDQVTVINQGLKASDTVLVDGNAAYDNMPVKSPQKV